MQKGESIEKKKLQINKSKGLLMNATSCNQSKTGLHAWPNYNTKI